MKITIGIENAEIQVGFRRLKNRKGAVVTVYYFSGERYQYHARVISVGHGTLVLVVADYHTDEDDLPGVITLEAETPEEKWLFSDPGYHLLHERDKETDFFFVLDRDLIEPDLTEHQYARNFDRR